MSRADDLDLAQLEIDPYSALRPLQELPGPVWASRLDMWVVTRYEQAVHVLRSPERYSNDSPSSTIQSTLGRHMLSVEGADQARYKQACLAPFTGKAVRDVWTPRVEDLCEACLDDLPEAGPVDLMAHVAARLPLETMAMVVGLPQQRLDEIHARYGELALALANFEGDADVAERGHAAADFLRGLLRELLERAAANTTPPVTLIDHLAHTPGSTLARSEAVANLLIVLFGGLETTESMIGNALWCLLTEAAAEPVRGDLDALLEPLIEESLRYEPAVQTLTRHTTGDDDLFGAPVRAGQTVQCMVSRINRDPDVFERPDSFELGRPNAKRHLSFGLGSHFCLGAQLARLETRSALRSLLGRFPRLSLDRSSSARPRGHEFRKPPRLAVHLA